jgi:hypothetical protein
VIDMVDRYERLGYRRAHRSTRFCFTPRLPFPVPPEVVPAAQLDLAFLAEYDARHFPARRERFLASWITQPGTVALALVEHGTLQGYGVIRPAQQGHKVGPLFAADGERAAALLGALCNHTQGGPVYLDVPEPNLAGLALTRRWGMEPVFACERMYLRRDPGLPLENIFGITTFEAG